MKILILSGVMITGTPVFPTTVVGTGKDAKKVPTVVDVDKQVAKELIMAKQAKLAPSNAKANVEIKPLEKEEADKSLDDFFGDENFDDDEKE